MVKKLKSVAAKNAAKKASPAAILDNALAGAVRDSAQHIWLAGMGAYAKAQQEGGKVFEALVKEGLTLQKKTQSVANEKFGEVTSKVTGMASDVGAKAGQHWDKLENIFEERVAKALSKLGVPSAREVKDLIARIDALSAQVAKANKPAAKATATPVAKAAKPAKKAAVKAVAKSAPAKATKKAPASVDAAAVAPKAVKAPRKAAARTAAA